MKTAKDWTDSYMRMLGMTEEQIVQAWIDEPEHCSQTKEFIKNIQLDAQEKEL